MAQDNDDMTVFACRDCGATFAADKVMIPGAEPLSEDKLPIVDNQCPSCGGILDIHFPEQDHR